MNILVVDDDPIHVKLATEVLASEGHQVTTVKTAEKAQEAIEMKKPEVIILDLSLPGMNGLALLRNLKHNSETRGIPVITVTSYPSKWNERDAETAGCDSYLRKPIDIHELIRLVAEVRQRK